MITPLHAALDELRTRREKLDFAIRTIEDLIGETPASSPPPVLRSKALAKSAALPAASNGQVKDEAIVAYLRTHGPAAPRELQLALRIEKMALRRQIKTLAKQKLIVLTGATSGRRIALPGHSAKEAP